MIWPDPTNSNVVAFDLFNPQGALVQQSYNDGEPPLLPPDPMAGSGHTS